MKEINVYLRDGVKMDKEKWDELLNIDCEEAKPGKPNGIMDVWEDTSRNSHLGYIHDIDDIHDYFHDYNYKLYLNGHYYVIKTTGWIYDSASEFCDYLLENFSDEKDLISDMILNLTDEEVCTVLSRTKKVRIENGKIIEKDEYEY